jgi:hypothetical protein
MWESGPWKQELFRTIERCEREFAALGRLPRPSAWDAAMRGQRAEKAVFLSAFIIRKLMDSGRLSIQVEDSAVPVLRSSVRADQGAPDLMNWEQLDRFYDIDNGLKAAVRLRHLTNWIVHSFVFLPEVESDHAGSDRLSAFWCNSDRTRGCEENPPQRSYATLSRVTR